ncbi:MAG: HNH endonuclease [Ruminococcus sp.]|nr:HNH endonuclease [Ruminococcus sp.]
MDNRVIYLSEIIESITNLGGEASFKEICSSIEERDLLPNIHTNRSWRNNVSTELTTHCKQMDSYRTYNPDLFYSVYGKGEGYWGLRSMREEYNGEISPIIQRQIDSIRNDTALKKTEKEMIIKSRIGQGIFRKQLIEKYGKCIITGIDDKRLLNASHIKPWRSSNNKERLSPENGLLLSSLYDKLFDTGLISFNNDMKIIVSNKLSDENEKIINIQTDKVYIDNPSKELLGYMKYHRKNVFK